MKKTVLSALVVAACSAFSAISTPALANTDTYNVNLMDEVDSLTSINYGSSDFKIIFNGSVSSEFDSLIQNGELTKVELSNILKKVFFDRSWTEIHGVEGVEVIELTDSSLTLGFKNSNSNLDKVHFSGKNFDLLLQQIAVTNINIKDQNSRLAMFDVDNEKSFFWIGGGKSDAASQVSQKFADLTGGSNIKGYEVKGLLQAAIDKHYGKDSFDGVKLVGINPSSFTLAVTESQKRTEYIIFYGQAVPDIIGEVAPEFTSGKGLDTGDCVAKSATWYTDHHRNIWLSDGNSALKTLVGHRLAKDELSILMKIVNDFDTGLPGVTLVESGYDYAVLDILTECKQKVDRLTIKGDYYAEVMANLD